MPWSRRRSPEAAPAIARAAAAARSAASPLPVEPRSSSTPGGTRRVRAWGSKAIADQPGTGATRSSSGRVVPASSAEVGVVPDDPERPADGGVDGAAGPAGGVDRTLERPGQERTEADRPAGGGVHGHQLAVGAEPAVRQVHVVEHALHGRTGQGEIAVQDEQTHPCPEGPPVRLSDEITATGAHVGAPGRAR